MSVTQQSKGFTLFELMVTLTVTGILATLATPSFSSLINQSRTMEAERSLAGMLRYARNIAITRNTYVTVCAKSTDRSCGSNWNHGMIAFADTNNNKALDPDEELIKTIHPLEHGRVQWKGFRKQVKFNHLGIADYYNGSFWYCPHDNDSRYAARIMLSKTGRTQVVKERNTKGELIYDGSIVHCQW